MKKLSSKTFCKACGVLYALLFALLFALVLHSELRAFVKLTLLAIVLLLGVLCFLLVWLANRKLSYFSENINSVLDEMLSSKDDIMFELYEETITSKVQSKLRQLYELMLAHARQSEHEKAAIQSLVSDISHQVKTPIANIKMYHDILSDRPVTVQQQKDFSASISGQIDRLDFLMQAMVKLSRLETGILKLTPISAPIYDTIAEALGS
ncbi:MAG: histidine kinase dimerization/phospho-acceptor domain-containing protein, partial [Clostridia bacterium]